MKAPCAEKLADEGSILTVYALPKVTNYLAQHRNWVRAAVLGRAKRITRCLPLRHPR